MIAPVRDIPLSVVMSETITIATACDNGYAQHTSVFLRSLFAKNSDTCFRIFIMVPDDFAHREAIERNIGAHNACLQFVSVAANDVGPVKVGRVTTAAYFRLFLGSLLPDNVERIIYFDSDIVINGPIRELWNIDLQDHVLGAVVDAVQNPLMRARLDLVRARLEMSATSQYINTGVLLIDLRRWRTDRIGEQALEFALRYPDRITWLDQDALNHVLNGDFKQISEHWNFQSHRMKIDLKKYAEARCNLRSAAVIHFIGSQKPWLYMCNHPMQSLYWKYLRQTEWRNYRPPDRKLHNLPAHSLDIIKRTLRLNAPALVTAVRRIRRHWRLSIG